MGTSTTSSFIIGTCSFPCLERVGSIQSLVCVKVVGLAYPVKPGSSRVNNTGHSPIKVGWCGVYKHHYIDSCKNPHVCRFGRGILWISTPKNRVSPPLSRRMKPSSLTTTDNTGQPLTTVHGSSVKEKPSSPQNWPKKDETWLSWCLVPLIIGPGCDEWMGLASRIWASPSSLPRAPTSHSAFDAVESDKGFIGTIVST